MNIEEGIPFYFDLFFDSQGSDVHLFLKGKEHEYSIGMKRDELNKMTALELLHKLDEQKQRIYKRDNEV